MKSKENQKVELRIGNPVEPMLVMELNCDNIFPEVIKEHEGRTYAEVKSDGNRIQVHKSGGDVRLFSRSLQEINPEVFPELDSVFSKLPKGIYDGEIVGIEYGIKGFKSIQLRKRKTLDLELAKKYPLEIKFFDVLKLEDKTLIDCSLTERRSILESNVTNISKQWKIRSSRDLESRYNQVVDIGLEGLVCKNPVSAYQIGKRTRDWIKIKKFMTLDLIVLGVYKGEGKAAQLPFAALLLGTKNNRYYESITKVGISNIELIRQINEKTQAGYSVKAPENVMMSDEIQKLQYERKRPLYYVKPEKSAIVEVSAMNVTYSQNWHSCGLKDKKAYSLRITIVQRFRDDKTHLDCATTDEISRIWKTASNR